VSKCRISICAFENRFEIIRFARKEVQGLEYSRRHCVVPATMVAFVKERQPRKSFDLITRAALASQM
jgi:hypothetical protein